MTSTSIDFVVAFTLDRQIARMAKIIRSLRKAAAVISRLSLYPGIYLVLFTIKLVFKKLPLRFATFSSDRIGHFSVDLVTRLNEIATNGANRELILYFIDSKKCCNPFLEKVARRNLRFGPYWIFYILSPFRSSARFRSFFIESSSSYSRDIRGLSSHMNNELFNQDEYESCKLWLKKHGWKEDQPLVGILSRDSAYMNSLDPGTDWKYHSYRDSDIQTFARAINWLRHTKNAFVVRLGSIAEERIELEDYNSFIDYPFEKDKSALLDVMLVECLDLLVSTGTGLDYFAGFRQIPIIFVNHLPIAYVTTYYKSITYNKHLCDMKGQNSMPVQIRCGLFQRTSDYIENNIEITDMNEIEISKAIETGYEIFIENRAPSKEVVANTEELLRHLQQEKSFYELHEFINDDFFFGGI